MITAERLHKRFEDGFVAVKDVSFSVAAGEMIGLLGPNGAGKTTTVNMLLGYVPPTSGRALVAGIDVNADPLEAKKRIGFVSENVLLYGPLTAAQNLRFFARIAGRPVPAGREAELLRRVGLERDARRRVETFSKGMRQRLGIAIALVKDPEALVMDEPTTGLDPVGTRDLNRLIADLRDAGKAVLLVTHDLYRLREIADRILVLRDGEVRRDVAARDVRDVERLYDEAMGLDAEVAAVG